MLSHTRLKLCVVLAAVCWSLLLIYVLSSLRGQPGGPAQAQRHLDALKEAGNTALTHVAKSQGLLSEFLQHAWQGNHSHSQPPGKLRNNAALKPTSGVSEAARVVVSGDMDSLLGVVAMMNSVTSNTQHPLHFYVTLPSALISHFKKWVSQTKLHSTSFTVKAHPPQVPPGRPHYAKVFISHIFPQLKGRFIYLDPDVIVQGDITELVNTPITSNLFAAFTKDCTSTLKRVNLPHLLHYSSRLNFEHPAIHALRIHPNTCAPNTGVFVSEAHLWANASQQMQTLISSNTKTEPIHSATVDEGEAALLAVVYGHVAPLPRAWHLPDLGARARVSYSTRFVKSAKLLHWNGHFKPWGRKAAFSDLWLRYYLPDPSGKYRPARLSPNMNA
ncbi:glycosyltransferase 8 domain-containing protein 1-like [Eriocheir sinensis]|uniref:glycosyltransferase 8 domain-containing protein 1-like n=1 Tax=Eriocheir sinensis TaxID=95602 RepID=UPI0021C851B3|nr:glycosyltransferase 8 domain-containing protein 1-like [Eriocheir sinensis]XP_050728175.1 glycosyltransferase 8 domain-containing protein 1-like [Eriocheir sinensis]